MKWEEVISLRKLRLLLVVAVLALASLVFAAPAAQAHTCFFPSYPIHYVDASGGHHCLNGTGYDAYGRKWR
jgi:hypothetical protein